MSSSSLIRLAASAANLAADAIEGKLPSVQEAVALLAGAANAMGVTDDLRQYLTDMARARVDAEVEEAIRAKVGGP